MEMTILGSAAAEGIPAIFCSCPLCQKAWKLGGKNMRSLTAYKISDTVRVDFGPCSLEHEYRFGLHSERLRHLIVTHPHEDHLLPSWFEMRRKGFAVLPPDNVLHIYGPMETFTTLRHLMPHCNPERDCQMEFHELYDGKVMDISGEDITIHAMLADHFFRGMALIYVLRVHDKYVLIANDTGYFTDEAWNILDSLKVRLDVAILDSTCSNNQAEILHGHMNINSVVAVRDRMAAMGLVTADTQVFANHFSHNGGYLHEDLEAIYNPKGIQVGYDGCVINY